MKYNKKEVNKAIDEIASLAATYKIANDGLEFVSEVKYWEWLTSEVVKTGNTPTGEKIPLIDGDSISKWISSKLGNESAEKYVTDLLVNRGAEYDFVKNMQNLPVEFLKGNRWRMATQQEDLEQGIDAIRYNIFTKKETTVQIKAGLSDSFKSVFLHQYMPEDNAQIKERMAKGLLKKRTPTDEVYVNGKIWDWRNSENGRNTIIKRGDNHPNVKKLNINDEELKMNGEKRFENATRGDVEKYITRSNAITQIGKGAVIGTAIGITASTFINYGRYKNGEIDEKQFLKTLITDGTQSGLQGGIVAAINIPVQLVSSNLGLGAPITIPVMIVVGKTAKNIIEPVFGKGKYLKYKKEIQYTTDLQKALVVFSNMSFESFNNTKLLMDKLVIHTSNSIIFDYINEKLDEELDTILEEI